MHDIQAATEAGFDDNTFDAPQTLLTPCTDVVGAECQIDEPREQLVSPKGHRLSMTGRSVWLADQYDRRQKFVRTEVCSPISPEAQSARKPNQPGNPISPETCSARHDRQRAGKHRLIHLGDGAMMFSEGASVGPKHGDRPQPIVQCRTAHDGSSLRQRLGQLRAGVHRCPSNRMFFL